ncbi:MAG: tyrosine-type recombinase/integrase, partial [Methylococcales bacterium]|nr:tyrosine-type recombinase/integrase [Methylococcales bacterium]
VGEAIVAYLQFGRQECESRRLFLRSLAPWGGLRNPSAVGSIVRRLLARSGVAAPMTGAHQFRHGLACTMLRQSASLGEIGEVLGHRRLQTTMIYTKVDVVCHIIPARFCQLKIA